MGTMLLEDFRTELKYILANRDDTGTTDPRLNRWVNKAYRHVSRPRVHKHIELRDRFDFQVVANQNEYLLTPAVVGHKLLGVVDVTYFESNPIDETRTKRDLKPRSPQWMNSRVKPHGPPQAYTFDSKGAEMLVLNTLPTVAEANLWLRVWHYKEPARLVDGAATVLGDYWDDVILMGAQFFAEWEVVSKAEATATGQLYQQMINETWDALELNAEDTEHEVEFPSEAYMAR